MYITENQEGCDIAKNAHPENPLPLATVVRYSYSYSTPSADEESYSTLVHVRYTPRTQLTTMCII